jgi:hypothetical protein
MTSPAHTNTRLVRRTGLRKIGEQRARSSVRGSGSGDICGGEVWSVEGGADGGEVLGDTAEASASRAARRCRKVSMLPGSALEGVYVCEEGLKGDLRAGAELSIPSLSLEEWGEAGWIRKEQG